MPDGFAEVQNKTCQGPFGKYTTVRSAIAHCKLDKPCIIYDDNADNVGPFRHCSSFDDISDITGASMLIVRSKDAGMPSISLRV